MIDPQQLIDIARQIDPTLQNPQQSLIEALVIARALALLGEATPPVSSVPVVRPVTAMAKRLRKMKTKARRPIPQAQADSVAELLSQLKDYKEQRHLSLTPIARRLRCSGSLISGWFRGKWKPSELHQERIRQLLESSDQ